MKHTDELELLNRIVRVDPPPFLVTRIEARIARRDQRVSPRAWVPALAVAALVVILNAVAIRAGQASHDDTLGELTQQMGLRTSNQLYR